MTAGAGVVTSRVAAGGVRRRLPRAVGGGRRTSSTGSRTSCPSRRASGTQFTDNFEQICDGRRGLGHQRAGRPARAARCSASPMSFLLMRFRLLNDMLSPLAIGAQRDPDLRARRRVQQHVLHHVGDPAAADGDARRLLHRARQRGQGPAPGRGDAPRAAALVRRQPQPGAAQGAHPQRRAVPVHGAEDRRAGSPSSRRSSPSTSAARRTASAAASPRT